MKRLVTSPIILAPFMKQGAMVLAFAALGVSIVPSEANASRPYPDTLKSATGAGKAPPCNICHMSVQGGDAVVGLFGKAMKAEGLSGNEAFAGKADMQGLLDKLGDKADSDKGGQPDIAELTAGQNPSNPDDDGGAGGKSGSGGGSGSGSGGSAGKSGSGGSGTGAAGAPAAGGAAGGGDDGNASQATSAGCSYSPFEASSSSGLLVLTGLGGLAAAYARRRKRSLETPTLAPSRRATLPWRVGFLRRRPSLRAPRRSRSACPSRTLPSLSQRGLSGEAAFVRSR